MTCREARRLLPFLAGGDLEEPRARALADHLGACAACRAEADAFSAARSLLSLTTMSFSPSERALVRRRVLDEIASRRERPSFFAFVLRPRFALAAAAGAVVLGASLLAPFFVRKAGEPIAVDAVRPKPVATPEPPADRAGERVADAGARPPEPTREAPGASRAKVAARTLSQTSANPGPPVRFEIQTGNVNVRIIWFGGGKGGDEPSSGPAGDPNGVS
jgi:hypothetical protein